MYSKNCLGTGRFLSETGSLWEQSKQKLKTKQTTVVPKKVIHIEPQLNYHVQNLARPPPIDIEIGHPCPGDVNAMQRLNLILSRGISARYVCVSLCVCVCEYVCVYVYASVCVLAMCVVK